MGKSTRTSDETATPSRAAERFRPDVIAQGWFADVSGTLTYWCDRHQGMRATIIITDAPREALRLTGVQGHRFAGNRPIATVTKGRGLRDNFA